MWEIKSLTFNFPVQTRLLLSLLAALVYVHMSLSVDVPTLLLLALQHQSEF